MNQIEEVEASSITQELLELNDLYKLHDDGSLDDDEFLKAKQRKKFSKIKI